MIPENIKYQMRCKAQEYANEVLNGISVNNSEKYSAFKDGQESGYLLAKEELEKEIERLKGLLEEIANPIAAMRKSLMEGEGLNGVYAIALSNDANYLKEIAKRGL